MEHASEDAPLAADSRAGSEQVLVVPTETRGSSNHRALKIAGLTTLACLLLASQIFTAYMMFDQKEQIQGLQRTNQKMERQLAQRPRMAPQKMVMPIGSLPLLDFSDDFTTGAAKVAPKYAPPNAPPNSPQNKPQDVTPPSVEKQLQELMEVELPHFNKTFLANLQTLKERANDTDWKSFESWLRYWLIFQMAQKTPTATPQPALLTRTKCQQATGRRGLLGNYKPQCDEQGNYKTMQCWHSTGQCWCVDESGNPIEGSIVRGFPDCDKILSSRASDGFLMMNDDVDK